MPLSHLTVNQEGQELKTHGTIALPIAIYNDDLLIKDTLSVKLDKNAENNLNKL